MILKQLISPKFDRHSKERAWK